MLYDSFNRRITYLRISVTDKCNLRCVYCMPPEGVRRRSHSDMLSHEQVRDIVAAGRRLGIEKVRLTGGEPLVRRGIVELVEMLRAVDPLLMIGMTTNGTLLAPLARDLKEAGLSSVNVSLDTLDPEEFHRITRGGDIDKVVEGIEAAREAGFPVKINTVVPGTPGGPARVDKTAPGGGPAPAASDDYPPGVPEDLKRFCEERGLTLQIINHYSLTEEKQEYLALASGVSGETGEPTRSARKGLYGPPGESRLRVLRRPPSCAECNRLRLLARGVLKPCLHSDLEIPVDFTDLEGSLKAAAGAKPGRGAVCTGRDMVEIGG